MSYVMLWYRKGLANYVGSLTDYVVPDPYYGTEVGFERVLDLVDDACDGLTGVLQRMLGAAPPPAA